jgi:hypothetical protein
MREWEIMLDERIGENVSYERWCYFLLTISFWIFFVWNYCVAPKIYRKSILIQKVEIENEI